MAEKFQLGEMAAALNCSRQLLDKWVSEDVLPPSEPASGPGTRRLYTRADLCRGAVLVTMANLGFNRRPLRDLQKKLKRMSEKKVRDSYIFLRQIDERGGFGPDGQGNYEIKMVQGRKAGEQYEKDPHTIVVGKADVMIERALDRVKDAKKSGGKGEDL
jgi:DNA-binding transcriptional MerR regulator